MSIVSTCTTFSYSHWNAFVNDEMKIVVGSKEQLIDQSTQDVKFQINLLRNLIYFFVNY
jgi:hypothetical protein